ncbi:MAG: hypothetical protein KDA51_20630, partial [Planctomycetales bacterium]|nr:hypothetical protein [Planctomycetales bacterium]
MAVSGDTVVVGAAGVADGLVYVFSHTDGIWHQQAQLAPVHSDTGTGFGRSVAISGDTVVVGTDVAEHGLAYVFVRKNGSWQQQAHLRAASGNGDGSGSSVAISGETIVVGSPLNADMKGAAYVFVRASGSWRLQAYLTASNADSGDEFGTAVAISGDRIVVGAVGESSSSTTIDNGQDDNTAFHSGAAYVFARNGAFWKQEAYLKASNTHATNRLGGSDNFGNSVAISGNTVVIGAFWEDSNSTAIDTGEDDNSAPFAGAAYVFVHCGGSWRQQAYLKAFNTDAGDAFGTSVAISDETVVIGANWESSNSKTINSGQGDNSARCAGAAYVFDGRDGSWCQRGYLKASNTDESDWFGTSVAISDRVVVIGAQWESSNSTAINSGQCDNSAEFAGA